MKIFLVRTHNAMFFVESEDMLKLAREISRNTGIFPENLSITLVDDMKISVEEVSKAISSMV